ncbi:MAG: lysylphosphatidylglycerol synthase transmembrane domain-containing protein [Leptolyngbyaceae cyanobacterium]
MKRLISIAVSLLILAMLYWKIELDKLIDVFRTADLAWMVVSLAMVVPITLFTAKRLQFLMPPHSTLTFFEANQLILAASSLNMVLPSKAGDIAKAYFMRDRGHLSGSLALSLVVFEKACDMLSLLLWCLFGLWLYPQKDAFFWLMTVAIFAGLAGGILLLGSTRFANLFFNLGQQLAPKKIKLKFKQLQVAWGEMHAYFRRDRRQLLRVTGMSVWIWLLHLLQIWFFILALNAWVPFFTNLALSPLAILAGLLPLTFAGVGTRDAALIYLYAPYFDAATGAALGLLCTSRYFLPALGGLPFLEEYLRVASWKPRQER